MNRKFVNDFIGKKGVRGPPAALWLAVGPILQPIKTQPRRLEQLADWWKHWAVGVPRLTAKKTAAVFSAQSR